jgi:hypothetical protein
MNFTKNRFIFKKLLIAALVLSILGIKSLFNFIFKHTQRYCIIEKNKYTIQIVKRKSKLINGIFKKDSKNYFFFSNYFTYSPTI